jgi:sodium-dependent dicarboxylate transporter 2/3/5
VRLLGLLRQERWLILGLLVGLVIALLPPPAGLSVSGMRVLGIISMAVIFFITEPIPLPTVALLIAVFQVVLGISGPSEVARSFMSDAVFFIMGSLMISVAIIKQGLDRRIALWIFSLTGPRTGLVVLGVVAISAILSSFIGTYTMAAMMLPVALTIISFAQEDHPEVRNLAALLLLAIAYGCTVGTLGTPSGGARNAIMLDYWDRLFNIKVGYSTWIIRAYPLVLLQIPVVAGVLLWTFRPEVKDLEGVIARLRATMAEEEGFRTSDWQVLAIFLLTLAGWITLSGRIGLGTVALAGVSLYLILGLVSWEDLNRGVDWGVVLLYAATISLGYQMKQTGAAAWIAQSFLGGLQPLGLAHGIPLLLAVGILTLLFSNTMSSGAAVAVLGPITLNIASLVGGSIIGTGFVTVIASTFAYLTVIAAPATTIVYASGYLKPGDLLRAGYKMALASVIILMGFVALYWPLIGLRG